MIAPGPIAPRPDERRQELAADFVRRFAEYWSAPTVDGLDALLADPVRMAAPLTPTTETREDGKRAFGVVLDAVPDLTSTVHRWGATADGVFIEFTLSGTVAGSRLSWDVVDRFVLGDDGLATERISYFDSAALQPSSPA